MLSNTVRDYLRRYSMSFYQMNRDRLEGGKYTSYLGSGRKILNYAIQHDIYEISSVIFLILCTYYNLHQSNSYIIVNPRLSPINLTGSLDYNNKNNNYYYDDDMFVNYDLSIIVNKTIDDVLEFALSDDGNKNLIKDYENSFIPLIGKYYFLNKIVGGIYNNG